MCPPLELLRCRARSVRAHYKPNWEELKKLKVQPFVFESPERKDNAAWENQNALEKYIADHVVLLERMRKDIERSEELKGALAQRNRSGRQRNRRWQI